MSNVLSQYEMAESAVLTFLTLDGDVMIGDDGVKPAQARIWSPGSDAGVQANHLHAIAASGRLMKLSRGEKLNQQEVSAGDKDGAKKLARVTAEFINLSADPLTVYLNPALRHMAEQVAEFYEKKASFSKGPSTK